MLAVAALIMIIGLSELDDMTVEVFPEMAPPTVEVQTEALGLSAVEVEQLITVPLEADLLVGVPWLEVMRSESVPGLSARAKSTTGIAPRIAPKYGITTSNAEKTAKKIAKSRPISVSPT